MWPKPALVTEPTTVPSWRIVSPPWNGAKPSTVSVTSRRRGPSALTARQRRAAEKVALVELDAEAETGLVGIGLRRDVARPVEIALLQPAGFDGAVAGIGDAVRLARLHDRVVEAGGVFDRHVQLPAEFADIADAGGADLGVAELDLADREIGKGGVGEVLVGERLEHRRAAIGPTTLMTA